MNLEEFAKQYKKTPTQYKKTPTASPLVLNNNINTAGSTPQVATKQKSVLDNSLFRFIGRQLAKPQSVATEAFKTATHAAGSLLLPLSKKYTIKQGLAEFAKSLEKGGENLAAAAKGNLQSSPGKMFENDVKTIAKITKVKPSKLNHYINKTVAIGSDLILDPLWAIEPLELLKYGAKATKLDKPIESLTQFAQKTKAYKNIKSVFSNTTGNKAFDEVVSKFRNLRNYREGALIDDAVQLQKDIKVLGKKQGIKNAEKLITDGLENPDSLYNVTKDVKKTNLLTTEIQKAKQEGKSFEEFWDKQDKVYRGEYTRKQKTNNAISTSLDKNVAKSFSENGKIKEFAIGKDAKIVDISDLRKDILGVNKLPNPNTLTQKQFQSITGDNLINYAKNKGYDVVDYSKANIKSSGIKVGKVLNEKEYQILNISKIKTKQEFQDLWNKTKTELPKKIQPKVNEKIINIVETLKNTYKELLNESKKVGLKVGEIEHYAPHIRTKESFLNNVKNSLIGSKEWSKGSIEKGRKLKRTINELEKQGINIFEKNPAIQLVKKGQQFSKAITAKEFANSIEKFAIPDGVKVSNPMLKGLKFAPEQAKVIDNFYQGIQPDELKVVIKTFDKLQNWWKAQALLSPSYHIRNIAGNIWNNFIAGVNPAYYFKAGLLQKGILKDTKLIDEMKKLGVIDEGWYAKDIGEEVLNRVEGIGNYKKGLNPLSQENYLFKLNKKIGSGIENNARIAHYLSKKAEGLSAEEAAKSVKKYLFDYGDLSKTEKNIFKRVIPFYTWTRKNLPIQLEGLITQPAKYVLPHKIIDRLESGIEVPNEKYMGDYIKSNIPVRTRKTKDGNTEYFLLGNWLPYASAIDILSQPLDNLIGMSTPFIKTPYEYFSDKSTYFKNTLGEPSSIRGETMGEFDGMLLKRKNILLLRNIRLLNDLNKWIDKRDPTAIKDSWVVKLTNTLFGKAATYDIGKAKYYYDRDTKEKIAKYKKNIKDAQRKHYYKKARKLQIELREFMKSRQ